jgi:hypothetical protein
MPELFGRKWAKDELRARIGGAEQLCGVERVVLDDGPGRGIRAAVLRTGTGLEAEVLLDRAMDLGRASFRGHSLCYRAPVGEAHPAYYDPNGLSWLRTCGAGMLATCGLQNVGSPCEDEGRAHGLHGGFSATPAHDVSVQAGWEGNQYRFRITGKIREVTPLGFFGPNVCVTRTVSGALGSNAIRIDDTVVNEGFTPAPLMYLYHVNVGFPVLDEGSRVVVASRKTEPRDATAKAGAANWDRGDAPQPGYAEQVFFHDVIPDAKGVGRAALVAPERPDTEPLALVVEYDAEALPKFIQWKQMGAGVYVMGLEPANCLVMGRADARKRGMLTTLAPGEEHKFWLRISVLHTPAEIQALEKDVAALKSKKK